MNTSEKIISYIKKGEIGIIPTDTLYGIVGSAFSKKAVSKIYKIKDRDLHKPFIVLISGIEDLKKFNLKLNIEQKNLLEKYWPSELSVILPVTQKKYEYLHRGTQSIAFRFPKKKYLIDLVKITGPLVAPSANYQGQEAVQTIYEAKKKFGDKLSFYKGGGMLVGKPSTLVSFVDKKPKILRQGRLKVDI